MAIAPLYFKDANCIILVYDITNRSSFKGLESWVMKLKDHLERFVSLCIIGNKIDLEDLRVVKTEELRLKAIEWGACWFETSAKNDSGIDVRFLRVTQGCFSRISSKV